MANWVTTNTVLNDRLFVESILSFVRGETVNCSLINSILGTYCKGTVGRKGDTILAGSKEASQILGRAGKTYCHFYATKETPSLRTHKRDKPQAFVFSTFTIVE